MGWVMKWQKVIFLCLLYDSSYCIGQRLVDIVTHLVSMKLAYVSWELPHSIDSWSHSDSDEHLVGPHLLLPFHCFCQGEERGSTAWWFKSPGVTADSEGRVLKIWALWALSPGVAPWLIKHCRFLWRAGRIIAEYPCQRIAKSCLLEMRPLLPVNSG